MSNAAIEVSGVSKRFWLRHEHQPWRRAALFGNRRRSTEAFWALRDVSFAVPEGSTFGIVGANGSGKSTLLRCMARILQPDEGHVTTRGRVATILEVGSGFHPDLSGRDNVFLNASILGIPKSVVRRQFDEIVAFAGVERFIDQPLKHYSAGMYLRLAFSVAIGVEPAIILVDEVMAVGDASFQRKCLDKFAEFKREGRSIVMVTHALSGLRDTVDSGVWLDRGKVAAHGDIATIVQQYQASTHRSDAMRRGSGGQGVDITSFEVLDAAGMGMRHVPGEEVRFRITYRNTAAVRDMVARVVVLAWDGGVIWSSTSAESSAPLSVGPGEGQFEVRVPSMPLAKGDFPIQAELLTIDGDVLCRVDDLTGLQMGDHTTAGETGALALRGRWTHERSATDAR